VRANKKNRQHTIRGNTSSISNNDNSSSALSQTWFEQDGWNHNEKANKLRIYL
jgi:hypothetical protein